MDSKNNNVVLELTADEKVIKFESEIKRVLSTCEVYRSLNTQNDISVYIAELTRLRVRSSCDVDKILDWALFMAYDN